MSKIKNGFTLIESLIVIIIISVIMGVVFQTTLSKKFQPISISQWMIDNNVSKVFCNYKECFYLDKEKNSIHFVEPFDKAWTLNKEEWKEGNTFVYSYLPNHTFTTHVVQKGNEFLKLDALGTLKSFHSLKEAQNE